MNVASCPVKVAPPDPARVAEIAAFLPNDRPVAPPASDRQFWEAAAREPYLRGLVAEAEAIMHVPPPNRVEWERTYRLFSTTGDRATFQAISYPYRDRVKSLALAECVENGGRFIGPLEAAMREICDWPTWVASAHDVTLDNLEGRRMGIDLVAATVAGEFAAVLMALGARLDPELVRLARAEIRRRVLVPFRDMLEGRQTPDGWMTSTNNWGAACLCGIAVAALGAGGDDRESAWYLAATERLIANFLAGFTNDGYCSEGVGYWNYGFGKFIVLAEYVRRATGGAVDLFDDPRARQAAMFPLGIEIVDGVYPAISDCRLGAQPTPPWTWYAARRLGIPEPPAKPKPHLSAGAQGLSGKLPFLDPEDIPMADAPAPDLDPLRHLFDEAGVLVCRAPGERAFGIAIKGGHNDEHHNHNDLGAFTIVVGGVPILCDPGKENYTRATFSEQRYESFVHNSHGHPVPVVAGRLQEVGRDATARILHTHFSPAKDEFVLDLRRAYTVEGLEKLERRMTFDRENRGIVIEDSVAFDEPRDFATALVAYGSVEREGNTLTFTDGGVVVRVKVLIEGAEAHYAEETLDANWEGTREGTPRRIAIECAEPVKVATISCVIDVK